MKIYRLKYGVALYFKYPETALAEFKKLYKTFPNAILRSQHNGKRSVEDCYTRFIEKDAGIEIVENKKVIAELMAINVIETTG